MTFCANPVGTQAIHACNCTFNDHLRVDEIVNKLFALYDPDLVTRRCQDHPPPAAAKHSRHAYSGGTHNDPLLENANRGAHRAPGPTVCHFMG